MTWEEFTSSVRTSQVGFMGEPNEVKPGRGEFHEHPLACICQNNESRAFGDSSFQSRASGAGYISSEANDEGFSEDEQDLSETDYADYDNGGGRERALTNRRDSSRKSEQPEPELEEIVSD